MKMERVVCILAVCLTVVYGKFTCEDLLSRRTELTDVPYSINTGGNTYIPGRQVNISIAHRHGESFRFIIQGSMVASNRIIGEWVIDGDELTTQQCGTTSLSDTVGIDRPIRAITLRWQSPSGADAVDVHFHVIFEDADGEWHRMHSVIMSPQVEPSTTTRAPIVGPEDEQMHDTRTEDQLKMDAAKKRDDEIDLENQASEDDWNKAAIEDMRMRDEEIHREEMEYEEALRRESEEQEARIRFEIRDKEEFDSLLREKERLDELEKEVERELEDKKEELFPDRENEIDIATAGSSIVLGSVACLILLVVQAFL